LADEKFSKLANSWTEQLLDNKMNHELFRVLAHIDWMVLDITARMMSRAPRVEPEPSLPNGNQELGTAWTLPRD